jgi:cytochrome c oxidase subunit 3
MSTQPLSLPVDQRAHQGGLLFLASLLVFFLASIFLYLMYAFWRRDDPQSNNPLPLSFILSTGAMFVVSGMVQASAGAVRRERRGKAITWLGIGLGVALFFIAMQVEALNSILGKSEYTSAPHKGVAGMVIVLAVLHALHVVGGVVAMALVLARIALGRYDHERHWALQFTSLYWHFLDFVWLCMLTAFWATSGGFQWGS